MPKRKVDDYYNNIGISSEHYDDDGTYWFTSDNGKRIGIKKGQNLEQALDNSGIPDDGKDYSDVTASDIANQEDDSQDVDDWKPEQDLQDDPDDNEYPEEEEPVPQTPEGTFGAPTADIIKDWTEDQLESAKKSMPAYRDIYDKELKKRIEDKQKSDGDGGNKNERKMIDFVKKQIKDGLPTADVIDSMDDEFEGIDKNDIKVAVNKAYDEIGGGTANMDAHNKNQANKREEASKWDEIKKEEITDETKKWSYKFARSKHNTNKKKPRELQEKQTKYDKLKNFDNEIWDENNFESGKDVYTHDGMSKYKKAIDNKLGGNLKFIDEEIEEWLTDENYHSLNQAVNELKSGIKDGEIEDWWDNSNEESKAKVLGDISYWDNKERKEKLNQSYDDSVMQSHIRLMYTINKKTEGESYAKEWGYEDWEEEYFEFEDWIENGEHYGYLQICKLCGMRHESHKIGEQREHLINNHGFTLNELEGKIPTYESEDDDLDEYGRNVNEDESSIWDLFKDNVPKSKEGIDKSQPFIPTRASDCPFNPDGRNHEFIKDQNSDVTCKHCGEEVTDYEVKLWGESVATEVSVFDWWDKVTHDGSDIARQWEGTHFNELPIGRQNHYFNIYMEELGADKYGDHEIFHNSTDFQDPAMYKGSGLDGWNINEPTSNIEQSYSNSWGESKATEDYDYEPKLDCLNCDGKGCGDCHGTGIYGESKATELSPEAQCPKCGSYKTILEGMSSLGYGKRRQYVCTNCYNVFQSEHSPKEIKAMYRDGTSPYDRNRWGESKASEGYVVFTSDGITQERHKEEWEAKDHAERIGGYVQKEISDDDWDLGKHYSISRDGDLGDIVYDALGVYDYANEGWDNQDPPRNPNFDRDVWVKKWGKDQMDYKHGLGKHTPCTNCDDGIVEMPDGTKTICSDCGGSGLENTWQGESKYTIEDESDQNDGEIQKDIESELHGEEKYVRGYENDWKDKLDTWDGRAVSDNFTTVQPYDPVNPKYECIYCNKEFSWDDTFTHDGSHGTLPSPYEDMGNT